MCILHVMKHLNYVFFFVRILQCSWLALLMRGHDKRTLKILVIYVH